MKTSTKNLLVAAASLILSAPIFSQTLITKWGSSVGMPCGFNYTCYDIQTAPNGNHIVTGNISSSAGIYADLNPRQPQRFQALPIPITTIFTYLNTIRPETSSPLLLLVARV